MNDTGETLEIFQLPAEDVRAGLHCHEPRPLIPRSREPVIASRVKPDQPTGHLMLANVYHGRNMTGIQPGEIDISFWRFDLNDPRLQFSRHILFNLDYPEQSLLLLAPLAKAHGGFGICHPGDPSRTAPTDPAAPAQPPPSTPAIFQSVTDPDYQTLLAMVVAGQEYLDNIERFDMPGFRPRPEYVREMKRFGVLPLAFDETRTALDPYEADQQYWESLWFRP